MFERPKVGERAILVHMHLGEVADDELLDEFEYLAISAGAEILQLITTKRQHADAKYFIGSGKAREIAEQVKLLEADLVIVNHALSPAQERNLERLIKTRVLDRTGLILDIFAQRARTYEGKLQVELAQCRHLSTRLIRGWTHLERQKGGIGLRGPGETQLETDRRLLRVRIRNIEKRLEKVKNQREQGRALRTRSGMPVLALVGYTNAGKSTLFNHLTDSDVYVQDQLFATLDPTIRQATVNAVGPVVFADTVGFVRDLPHDLVAAFRATLEETLLADILLHVIDASDPNYDEKIMAVREVLVTIGADKIPELMVYNKIDQTEDKPGWNVQGEHTIAYISATKDLGLEQLQQAIAHMLSNKLVVARLKLPPALAGVRAQLYDLGVIEQETFSEQGEYILKVSLPKRDLEAIFRKERVEWQDYRL